jgi:uncharacterized SAM-binding protein YcdF (DUF218 family)
VFLFFTNRPVEHAVVKAFIAAMLVVIAFYYLISWTYRIERCGRLLFALGMALLLDTCMCLFTLQYLAGREDAGVIAQLSNAILLFGGGIGANTVFASFKHLSDERKT